jgi:hypothetical protein
VEEIHRRAFAHTRRDQPLIENLIAGGRGGFGRFANPEYVQLVSSHRGLAGRFVDHSMATAKPARSGRYSTLIYPARSYQQSTTKIVLSGARRNRRCCHGKWLRVFDRLPGSKTADRWTFGAVGMC